MGIYATTTSLATLMIGTTFDSVTTALCTKLITHSENEINKYLSKRYDLTAFNATSTAVPPIVTSWCETLTEGYMYQRMARGSKDSMDRAKKLIDQVLLNLNKVADFELSLINSSGDVIADMSSSAYNARSTTSDYSNTFNEDDQLNWEVDQDKLDAIDSERD